MFIISKIPNSFEVLKKFSEKIHSNQAKVFQIECQEGLFLSWVSLKPSDNLHIYSNGYIIGKISFDEPCVQQPVKHSNESVPIELHPLLQSVTVLIKHDSMIVRPTQHKLVFYSENSISDSQLIIAKTDSLLPDLLRVAAFSVIGYLPGNITLFPEVNKVPYLEEIEFPTLTCHRYDTFEVQKPDNNKMIERLVSIAPRIKKSCVALSGGPDSRFTLGLLLKNNIRPKLYTFPSAEKDIVKEVGEKTNLEYELRDFKLHDPYLYTLMTDGRIYFRGGHFKALFNTRTDELMYSGLWADPLGANVIGRAWKLPGTIKDIYKKMIRYGLLNYTPDHVKGFNRVITRDKLQKFIINELQFLNNYYDFKSRRQWTNWFFHLNRGLNWANAVVEDASYYIYPIFNLGDKTAIEYGIGSNAYENISKDRLRALNRYLLPEIKIDYSGNRKYSSNLFFLDPFHKLKSAYIVSAIKTIKTKHDVLHQNKNQLFTNIDQTTYPHFEDYFNQSLEKLLKDDDVISNVKRAAVTVNFILKFLHD